MRNAIGSRNRRVANHGGNMVRLFEELGPVHAQSVKNCKRKRGSNRIQIGLGQQRMQRLRATKVKVTKQMGHTCDTVENATGASTRASDAAAAAALTAAAAAAAAHQVTNDLGGRGGRGGREEGMARARE